MKKYRYKVFLALFLLIIQVFGTSSAQAELVSARQEIRVGLSSLYSGKETLTINNKKLGYGYCVNNKYLQEVVLISTSGFTFVPVNGYVVTDQTLYENYQAAAQAAEFYQNMGIEAYPGSVYQCSWKVYFKNTSGYAEAERLAALLKEITGKDKFEVLSDNQYRVKMTGSFGTVLVDVDDNFSYPQLQPLEEYENGVLCVDMGERVYRGRIEIGRYNKTALTAVNVVSLEEYLYGVVPAEMPSNWPEEALKAQTVCARSYALIKASYGGASNAKNGYKLVDTVSSQVYKGYLAETVKTNRAVDETRGKMICYNNKVVAAYYFSGSGGSTESSKAVWAVDVPYLQNVPDFYGQDAGRFVWQKTMRLSDIKTALKEQGISFQTVDHIAVSGYTASQRVNALRITGKDRSLTLQGTTIRTVLNLDSTKFKIVKQGDTPDKVAVLSADGIKNGRISEMYVVSAEGVAKASASVEQYIVQGETNFANYPRTAPIGADELLFAGMGSGHGVGMSQYGAKGMAEAGYTYKEIIEYYFTGANVR